MPQASLKSDRKSGFSSNAPTYPLTPIRHALDLEDICLYTPTMRFAWDPAKARANLHDHGVSFAEAVTVLEDDFALTREDPDAQGEQRFVTLGLSSFGNLLVVVYTYREPDTIRLVSAWKANKRQRVRYEKGRR